MTSVRLFVLLLSLFVLHSALTIIPGKAQTVIYVDADASAPGDGTSWGSAYPALQDAFDQVNANPGTDFEIWVAQGTYYPDLDNVDNDGNGSTEHTADSDTSFTLIRDGVAVYGGFVGSETNRSSRDPSANVVTLSGDIGEDDDVLRPNTDSDNDSSTPTQTDHINGTNATHVVLLDGRGSENITSTTILDGVTVMSGKADGSLADRFGGGIICRGSNVGTLEGNECSPALTDVIVQGNHAVRGGGIHNLGAFQGTASPSFKNPIFRWNVAEDTGGGMHNDVRSDGSSSPSIDGGRFINNYSLQDAGALSGGSPTITGVRFENNSAERFGGAVVFAIGFGGSISPQITDCEFIGNGERGVGLRGGALDIFAWVPDNNGNLSRSAPDIQNTTFSNNAAVEGAAVFIRALEGGVTNTEISGSDFSQNNAKRGGAIQVEADTLSGSGDTSTAKLSISSSTFTSNTADQEGGAMAIVGREGGEARPEITDVTFSSNAAGHGGAVDVFGNGVDGNGNPGIAFPTFTDVKFLGNSATGLSKSSGGAFIKTEERPLHW